eukprot:XP_001706486.1 Hypothetical protein GL50803_112250 [Giardia lamblia ATCC 50803]
MTEVLSSVRSHNICPMLITELTGVEVNDLRWILLVMGGKKLGIVPLIDLYVS